MSILNWIHKRRRITFEDRIHKIRDRCGPDCGIFNPPMTAQDALNELQEYFLGEDWYDATGETTQDQVNTEIVCEIEQMYYGHRRKKK